MPHTVGTLSTRAITFLHTSLQLKVCTSCKSPNFENFETPKLGVPGQNDIWVQALWPSTNNTIREKVVASPKFGPWWVLWVHVCPWLTVHQRCSNYALTSLLFGLCKSMWIIDSLVTHPSPHPGAPACPSTLEVLRAKERTPTPYPSIVFTFGFIVESIKEFGGASIDYQISRV